jgi:hypothetical protein
MEQLSPAGNRPVASKFTTVVPKMPLSISNGHLIIVDMGPDPMDRFLQELRGIPFVRKASFASRKDGEEYDGMLTLRTEQGTFQLPVQLKLSYLDHASTNAIMALAGASTREGHPLLLLARYIPLPTGERLVAADVNFIDLVGNMHLALGSRYARTILGRAEAPKHHPKRAMTAAQAQLLFLLAAEPAALTKPLRKVAAEAGISKSKAAQVRRQLLERGPVENSTGKDRGWPPRDLQDRLLKGYSEALRPKLALGRFRYSDGKIEDFLDRLPAALKGTGAHFSLTGGPAAELLQHFYRGPEVPLFLDQWSPELQKKLRLLPDRHGPVTILRAFGIPAFWRTLGNLTVAHPWLIYSELMYSDDPRAHEAAEELKREFLSS